MPRSSSKDCQPTAHTSNSLIVPVHMHPSLGQTAAKASTSLRAALSGKAWESKRCYSLTQQLQAHTVWINASPVFWAAFGLCCCGSQRGSLWELMAYYWLIMSNCTGKWYFLWWKPWNYNINALIKETKWYELLTPPNLRMEAGSSNRSSLIHALHVCGPALKEKRRRLFNSVLMLDWVESWH